MLISPCVTPTAPPSLQVDEVTVNFNAKISSVTQSNSTAASSMSTEGSASASFGGINTHLQASYSNQQTEQDRNTEQREFSMAIYVKAVQDAMPAGMQKIMSVLEDAVLITLNKYAGGA